MVSFFFDKTTKVSQHRAHLISDVTYYRLLFELTPTDLPVEQWPTSSKVSLAVRPFVPNP